MCYEFYLPDIAKALEHYRQFLALGGNDARVQQLVEYKQQNEPKTRYSKTTSRQSRSPDQNLEVVPIPELSRPAPKSLPHFVSQPKPVYPLMAKSNGWEGTFVLHIEMLAGGTVGEIKVATSSGYPILGQRRVRRGEAVAAHPYET